MSPTPHYEPPSQLSSTSGIWLWLSKMGTLMACPGKWKIWTKSCGPIPGGFILTHTHFLALRS